MSMHLSNKGNIDRRGTADPYGGRKVHKVDRVTLNRKVRRKQNAHVAQSAEARA